MSKKLCPYDGCKLPLNNYRYLWQFAYILLGLIILYWKEENFTFFQVFLFVFPVLIDVSYGALDSKIMNIVRYSFLFLNLIILGVCVLGFTDIMVDTGNAFFIKLEVVNVQVAITKIVLGRFMLLNIIIPMLYFICSPCQKNVITIFNILRLQKGGKK